MIKRPIHKVKIFHLNKSSKAVMYLKYLDAHRKIIEKFILTRISCPIQAKETVRYTAQTTAKAMQNGETAKVRYETAPKKGTLMNDCPELLNHLKKKYVCT